MPQIVVIGDFGIRSLGDDAMLQVLVHGILERVEDAHIVPFSWMAMEPRRDDTYETMRDRVMRFVESSTRLLFRAGGKPKGVKRVVQYGLWDVFEQADLVIFGGGNLLTDINPSFFTSPMQRYTYLAGVAQAMGIPLVACGLSVGPFRTLWAPHLARFILERCAAITVRDQMSLDAVETLGLQAELLPDLALGLEAAPERLGGAWACGQAQFLIVSPRQTDERCAWLEPVAEALFTIHQEIGLVPLLIPHCRLDNRYASDDDTHICVELQNMLGGEVPILDESIADDPPATLALYGRCAASLSMRMHGAVFAALAGIPFVALDYWPKVRGFCDQVGAAVLPLDASADEITSAFLGVWRRREAETVRVREQVTALRNQIHRHFDIVTEVLR